MYSTCRSSILICEIFIEQIFKKFYNWQVEFNLRVHLAKSRSCYIIISLQADTDQASEQERVRGRESYTEVGRYYRRARQGEVYWNNECFCDSICQDYWRGKGVGGM